MSASRRAALAVLSLLAGCTVGPDYKRPEAPVPGVFKEAGWQPSAPQDAAIGGPWWSVYGDPVLDRLEGQVEISNQNLKAAEAAYRQAQAIVGQARAGFFPTLALNASGQRSGSGAGGRSGGAAGSVTRSGQVANQFNAAADASWAPDVWGRIRRTVEGDVATAQASAADLAAARLLAQSQLATDYFGLRVSDELKRLLDAAVAGFSRSLQITRNQHAAGTVTAADVATAETQVKTTQAQAIAVGVQRAQFEHAIAILTGKPPAGLSIAPVPALAAVPEIPAGVPSTLLERRPDIAAAERRMAATNAQIGVAEAAYYPNFTLSASLGSVSAMLGNLFAASNRIWSLGSAVAETIFDGGARGAQVAVTRAGYDQAVANYRQTVLIGFQQVEDQLSSLRILAQQAAAEDEAVASAREAERLVTNQYLAGTVPYTNVIVVQNQALNNAETALTIRRDRLTASVALIQALGGGWDAGQLPGTDRVEAGAPP